MSLSVLARLLRKGAFEKFESGEYGTRDSARKPAVRGYTRGTMGVTGVRRIGPATRNVDAADDKDREMLMSPIARAYLGK